MHLKQIFKNQSFYKIKLIKSKRKISEYTSRGSNIPLRVTIICLGCSSTGNERIKAATSSAVFHLAN